MPKFVRRRRRRRLRGGRDFLDVVRENIMRNRGVNAQDADKIWADFHERDKANQRPFLADVGRALGSAAQIVGGVLGGDPEAALGGVANAATQASGGGRRKKRSRRRRRRGGGGSWVPTAVPFPIPHYSSG